MRLDFWLASLYRRLSTDRPRFIRSRRLLHRSATMLVESLESRCLLSGTGAARQVVTTTLLPGQPIDSILPILDSMTASRTQASNVSSPVTSYQGAGLVITPTFDASITSDPNATTIETTINNVIAEYEAAFSDAITVKITFKKVSSGLGSSDAFVDSVAYSTLRSKLAASATTGSDAIAMAHLPTGTTEPVTNGSTVSVKTANERALGLNGAISSDGDININIGICNLDRVTIDSNKFDLAATAAHEIDEILGLGSDIGVAGDIGFQDLFRYDVSGNRSYTTSTSAQAFFSIDGTTDIVQFNQSGGGADYGDWASSGTPRVQDAFGTRGGTEDPGFAEFTALDVQGYHFVLAPTGLSLSNASVEEHSPVGTAVGTFSTTQGGAGHTQTYSLVSGTGSTDNADFSINANGQLLTNAVLDFKTQSSYSIRVRTTDEKGFFLDKAFTITLTQRASQVLTVDVLGDTHQAGHTTLREAINTANSDGVGDTINFANGLTGKITLGGTQIAITAPMTITGPGSGVITISGGGSSRIFGIDDSTSATSLAVQISGLTFTQGNAAGIVDDGSGGAIENNESLTLLNDVFTGNQCFSDGGAIENSGTLASSNSTFSSNTSQNDGGAVESFNVFTSLNDTFNANTAMSFGGAVESAQIFNATNDTFYGNTGNLGGAISNLATMTTVNVTVTNNVGTLLIGGVHTENGTWNSLNTIVAGNTTTSTNPATASDADATNSTVNARNTLIGDANSAAGITNGSNGNQVGRATNTIFVTNGNGVPVLANNGGPTQTVALIPGSAAAGTGASMSSLSSAVSNSATSFAVTSATFFSVGDLVKVDSEIVQITGISSQTLTVIRAQNSTTAASHSQNAVITLAFDQTGALRPSLDLGAVKAPLNHAPVGTAATKTTLEDTSYTFRTTDFGFTDPNDSPPNTLLAVKISTLPANGTLSDNGTPVTAGQFILASDISGSKLTYAPTANGNGTPFTSFTFQVKDNGGTAGGGTDTDPTPKTMSLNVTSVNDAPTAVNGTVSTFVNNTYKFKASDFGFSDPNDNPANSLSAVKFTTLPTSGTLSDNGTALTAGQSVAVADINAGKLTFAPNSNLIGGPLFLCKFQVQDNGGTTNGGKDTDPTAKVLYVKIANVNHAPSGTSGTVTTPEDTAYKLKSTDFGFTDPNDSPANTLLAVKITLLPSTGSLTDNGTAVTANQLVSAADISAGKLIYTPKANLNGGPYFLFKFQVQDNGGTGGGGIDLDQTAKVLNIGITGVNDAPSGTSGTVTGLEDAVYKFKAADFGMTDLNDSPANSLLNVKITVLPTAGVLTDNGRAVTANQFISSADLSGGKFVFTPTANLNGGPFFLCKFQVQDNGGTTNGGKDTDPTARVLSVALTSVNDAPSGASTTISFAKNTTLALNTTNFGFTDPNDHPANTLLAVIVTSLPGVGSLTDNGIAVTAGQSVSVADITSGKFKYTPPANTTGAGLARIQFKVRDNGGTSNGGVDTDPTAKTLTINVT